MKTTTVTADDLRTSVLAVPPLAREASGRLDAEANRALIRHMEDGGVRTLLYGGNANLYNIGGQQYDELITALASWVQMDTWVIPSFGPSFGQLHDQAHVLQNAGFPTAMVLPYSGPNDRDGVMAGLRKAAELLGAPIVLYVKWEDYLTVDQVAELLEEGTAFAVKYAIVRDDPSDDLYLSALIDRVDRSRIVSGIGERPAITHLTTFGLPSFTSGSVAVAPRMSMALLRALHAGHQDDAEALRANFLPLEDLRDAIHPIRVLHDAVTEADIADMGPLQPMLSNLSGETRARVREAARALLDLDSSLPMA